MPARTSRPGGSLTTNFDRPYKPLGKLTPAESAKLHGVMIRTRLERNRCGFPHWATTKAIATTAATLVIQRKSVGLPGSSPRVSGPLAQRTHQPFLQLNGKEHFAPNVEHCEPAPLGLTHQPFLQESGNVHFAPNAEHCDPPPLGAMHQPFLHVSGNEQPPPKVVHCEPPTRPEEPP